MSIGQREPDARLLNIFAYGSVVSTYILILIGGYVTTTNSGLACGESWSWCNGAIFPSLNNPAQVIEFTHRIFNLVVAFFFIVTALLVWSRSQPAYTDVLFSTS